MKYIKWIKVTLTLGICYILQKVVVNKFGSKKDEQKKGSEPSARPYMPGGKSASGDAIRTHTSDFGVGAGTIQLIVRF